MDQEILRQLKEVARDQYDHIANILKFNDDSTKIEPEVNSLNYRLNRMSLLIINLQNEEK